MRAKYRFKSQSRKCSRNWSSNSIILERVIESGYVKILTLATGLAFAATLRKWKTFALEQQPFWRKFLSPKHHLVRHPRRRAGLHQKARRHRRRGQPDSGRAPRSVQAHPVVLPKTGCEQPTPDGLAWGNRPKPVDRIDLRTRPWSFKIRRLWLMRDPTYIADTTRCWTCLRS